MSDYTSRLAAKATDKNGRLVYTNSNTDGGTGAQRTVEIDVTALNEPGTRRTGNHDILRLEAELMADGHDLQNAAKPKDGEIAKDHVDWCDRNGLTPAWELCDYPGWSR